MTGILVINKPAGYTSMDCCAIVRKAFGEKKVGHTGTLDPNATGVLPICIGKATRLIEYMDEGHKTYIAGFKLGLKSDTEDIWGKVEELDKEINISKEKLTKAANTFIGSIEQIPPMYSAKKVNGKKLVDLARKGQVIERKPAKIYIYSLKIIDFDGACGTFEVECSRGTYVRTLISDLGKALGTEAVMTSLVRTKAAGFTLDDAINLETIKNEGASGITLLPIERALEGYYKADVNDEIAHLILNGNPAFKEKTTFPAGIVQVVNRNNLIAVLKDGEIEKVFHESL